jgi:hypothetical protein
MFDRFNYSEFPGNARSNGKSCKELKNGVGSPSNLPKGKALKRVTKYEQL